MEDGVMGIVTADKAGDRVGGARKGGGAGSRGVSERVGLLESMLDAVRPVEWSDREKRDVPPKRVGSLTVLIPAYNEGKFIGDTIRSVLEQTMPADEIIVVDDCSSDNTGDVARAMGVKVLRPEKNCGSKATALNFALPHIRTEFTLAIDADTTLAPDGIAKLMEEFHGEKNIAAVCGMVIPRNVKTMWERGRYVEYLYAFTFYKPVQDYYGRPLIASGCFSAYRTDILNHVGGWSTRTVGEDMDLTWSMYRLGKTVKFAPEAVCYPVEPHNFGFLRKQLKRWSHGFAQCVKVHWKDMLEVPYMRTMIAVAMWDALMAVVGFFVLLPALAIFVHPLFLLGYFIDIPTVCVPVLYAAYKRGETARALASLPGFFVLRFVNAWFMIAAFWSEFVAGRRLDKFEKGHG